MPFKSSKQERYLWAKHPDIARKWTNEFGSTVNAHPGFKAVQAKIEGEGYSKDQAGAILASKTRNASPAAKAKNPKLKKVKMGKEQKSTAALRRLKKK